MSRLHNIIVRPILSEKTALDTEHYNKVTFKVSRDATKTQIRAAIEQLFGVRVARVNTHVIPGKPKRFGRNFTRTAGYKKAVITLAEGEVLDLFALEGDFEDDDEFGPEAFESNDD